MLYDTTTGSPSGDVAEKPTGQATVGASGVGVGSAGDEHAATQRQRRRATAGRGRPLPARMVGG